MLLCHNVDATYFADMVRLFHEVIMRVRSICTVPLPGYRSSWTMYCMEDANLWLA